MQHELAAREYKLLLEPGFELSLKAARAFWQRRLRPIIAARLDRRDGGESRDEGDFESVGERIIRFRDTPGCVLTGCDYALRERLSAAGETAEASRREITLKLRMPDLFVVAATDLPGSQADAQTKFEEDIAPLEIAEPDRRGQSVAIASPRSMRSRFALSTSQTIEGPPQTLAQAFALFPTLEDNLQSRGAQFSPGDQLCDGPIIREFVCKGAKVRLGDGIAGKFALTLWQFDSTGPAGGIAEISYKCKTPDGIMPGNAARRAFDLFIGLQEDLADSVDRHHASKTALVLPTPCGDPVSSKNDARHLRGPVAAIQSVPDGWGHAAATEAKRSWTDPALS